MIQQSCILASVFVSVILLAQCQDVPVGAGTLNTSISTRGHDQGDLRAAETSSAPSTTTFSTAAEAAVVANIYPAQDMRADPDPKYAVAVPIDDCTTEQSKTSSRCDGRLGRIKSTSPSVRSDFDYIYSCECTRCLSKCRCGNANTADACINC
jgi:hypothetical protein